MPTYRALSTEELQSLEKEFIDYLVVNGITADEWVKIKAEEQAHALRIIDLFSDVVFEGIMRKVQFLEVRSRYEVRTFQCLPEKIILAGMRSAPHDAIDFTNPQFVQEAMQNPPAGLEIYTSEKPYAHKREEELFAMTESGCAISDGKLFKAILLAKAQT